MASQIDDLEKLADLKNKGIITEEEFNKKKREILDGTIVDPSVGHNNSSNIKTAPFIPRDIHISYEKKKVIFTCNRDELFFAIIAATQHIDGTVVKQTDAINGNIVIETENEILKLKSGKIFSLNVQAINNNSCHVSARMKAKGALISMSAMKDKEFHLILNKALDLLRSGQINGSDTISNAGDSQNFIFKPYMQPNAQVTVVQRGEGCFLRTLNAGCFVAVLLFGIVIIFLYFIFNK